MWVTAYEIQPCLSSLRRSEGSWSFTLFLNSSFLEAIRKRTIENLFQRGQMDEVRREELFDVLGVEWTLYINYQSYQLDERVLEFHNVHWKNIQTCNAKDAFSEHQKKPEIIPII